MWGLLLGFGLTLALVTHTYYRLRSDGTGAGSAHRLDGADAAFTHSPDVWVRSVSGSVVVMSSKSVSTGSSLLGLIVTDVGSSLGLVVTDAGVAADSALSSKNADVVSFGLDPVDDCP